MHWIKPLHKVTHVSHEFHGPQMLVGFATKMEDTFYVFGPGLHPASINWNKAKPRLQQCPDCNVINQVPTQQRLVLNEEQSNIAGHQEPRPRSKENVIQRTNVSPIKNIWLIHQIFLKTWKIKDGGKVGPPNKGNVVP